MKIHDSPRKLNVERRLGSEKQSHTVKEPTPKQKPSFQDELQLSQKKQLSQRLKALLIEIDDKGKTLVKIPTMDILSQYKDLIKQFLREVTQNLYHAEETKHIGSGGKQKVLVIVKNVNKALEDLVKMVLNKEGSNLKLLDKVGEIKGMLIDLYS